MLHKFFEIIYLFHSTVKIFSKGDTVFIQDTLIVEDREINSHGTTRTVQGEQVNIKLQAQPGTAIPTQSRQPASHASPVSSRQPMPVTPAPPMPAMPDSYASPTLPARPNSRVFEKNRQFIRAFLFNNPNSRVY